MIVAAPTRTTWRTVLAEAIGPGRCVVDVEGASGEWRLLLEQNGYVVSTAAAESSNAVVARHLVSRLRDPVKCVAEWVARLAPAGRIVLLESAVRRGPLGALLGRRNLLFPPRRGIESAAPFRHGLSPAEASLLLQAAGLCDIRSFALPVPPPLGVHYLVSARRR